MSRPGRKSPVEPWIAAVDAMLLASEVEGLPNVLLKAQALGVPVVTTKAGGSGEAVVKASPTFWWRATRRRRWPARSAACSSTPPCATARVGAPVFIKQRFGLQHMLADTLAAYAGQLNTDDVT